jgi:hypothetical protein
MAALDIFGPASAPGAVTSRPSESRTFGALDTFFADCSSATADDGTEFQAAFFNQMLVNVRALARANGQTGAGVNVVTENNADDNLLLKSMQQLIQRGQTTSAVDIGTAGHVVAMFTPAVVEHKFGMVLRVKIANDNAGATDFAPNGLPAAPITRIGGLPLQQRDLVAGGMAELSFDGTQYQLLSMLGPGVGSTTKAPRLIGVTASGSGQSVPSTISNTMNLAVSQNNLWGTSTFAANKLTVGAGEAGLWLIEVWSWWPSPVGGFNCAIVATVNGASTNVESQENGGQSANGAVCMATGFIKLNVGDQVSATMYQQTGGTVATNGHYLSAYLVSSF